MNSVQFNIKMFKLNFLFILCVLFNNVGTFQDVLISDLNGLSELPLEKLLQVKNSLETDAKIDDYEFEERIIDKKEDRIGIALGNPVAQASALQGKFKKPLQRGSYEMWQKKGGSSKKGLTKIFQITVTALAFLAFAGYLLCLLVQAIRAKQNSTATATTAGGALVIAAPIRRQRPIIIRQKRDVVWPEAEPEELYFALRQFSEGFANYHAIDYKYYNYTVDSLG